MFKRPVFFAYGVICYLVFLATFLHAIAFVGGFLVPRRWFKERWTQVIPWSIERSTYVLLASLALQLLFWQWRPIGTEIWTVANPIGRAALWTLIARRVLTATCAIPCTSASCSPSGRRRR